MQLRWALQQGPAHLEEVSCRSHAGSNGFLACCSRCEAGRARDARLLVVAGGVGADRAHQAGRPAGCIQLIAASRLGHACACFLGQGGDGHHCRQAGHGQGQGGRHTSAQVLRCMHPSRRPKLQSATSSTVLPAVCAHALACGDSRSAAGRTHSMRHSCSSAQQLPRLLGTSCSWGMARKRWVSLAVSSSQGSTLQGSRVGQQQQQVSP